LLMSAMRSPSCLRTWSSERAIERKLADQG
jgi:hypothetical protein